MPVINFLAVSIHLREYSNHICSLAFLEQIVKVEKKWRSNFKNAKLSDTIEKLMKKEGRKILWLII